MESATFLLHLGRRLRLHRTSRGLSQARLGELAGLSPRYVSQLESGKGNVSIVRLWEVARVLGVPLEELVRLDEGQRIIALIGLRGAGKTTIGKRLARALKRPFYELDRLIEKEAGLRLGEIFALHGETYYRRLEREVLSQFLSSGQPAVLATGGGLVTDRTTYETLKRGALTVWLKTTPEEHLDRVVAQGDRRPMAGAADPLAALRALLRDRQPLYSEATMTIETSARTPEEVTETILENSHQSDPPSLR
jgi:XRE family aerobic/anaerobic benzoate catabolism transcriptional regulator